MIRKAVEADVPQLAELFRQLHEYHVGIAPESHRMPFSQYFELEIRSYMQNETMTVLVSDRDGIITAYAIFYIFDRERAERTHAKICYIEHLAVEESVRRNGEGSMMFAVIKNYAEKQGCDLIQLGAAAENSAALKFYESMGMTPRTIKMQLKLNK